MVVLVVWWCGNDTGNTGGSLELTVNSCGRVAVVMAVGVEAVVVVVVAVGGDGVLVGVVLAVLLVAAFVVVVDGGSRGNGCGEGGSSVVAAMVIVVVAALVGVKGHTMSRRSASKDHGFSCTYLTHNMDIAVVTVVPLPGVKWHDVGMDCGQTFTGFRARTSLGLGQG